MFSTQNSPLGRKNQRQGATGIKGAPRRKSLRGRFLFSLCILATLALLTMSLAGCSTDAEPGAHSQQKPIVLGDASWDSIQVHNRIAGFILEHGYGYQVDYLFGETLPLLQGLSAGGIDIYMEVWSDNIFDAWQKALAEGTVKDLGLIFPDAPQGWYVPTYMIKGDAERGIEPVTPDLKTVADLPKYKDLFKDPEITTKGRFHNGPPGWAATLINEEKFDTYELNETYNLFATGSDTSLAASMFAAYEKGEPWLGYYWEPTAIMGKLDMTLIEEPPFEEEVWEANKGCHYPAAKVQKGITSELESNAPEIVEFLEKYATTLEQNNELLAYLDDHDQDLVKTAHYFFENYPTVWKAWVPEDVIVKVEKALNEA